MKQIGRYIFILFVFMTVFHVVSDAQNVRPESVHENMLVKAVNNYI